MLDNDTQSRLLQQYPMLRELPAAERESLHASASTMHVPAGTVVFDENQPCQGFPLLLSGSIRVIKAAPNGRELQLYRVLPGESCILTSSCLLGHTRYQARGVSEEALEMVLLPATSFHTLFGKHEAFRNYVFLLFSDRLTDLMQLVSAVAFQKLDQRLARLIVSKSNPLHTTHQALADELGSAREIVSRLLKGFAEQGWVKLGREQIEVTDTASLRKFAEL
ncbi:MAG: transcriptional regulator [Gallionellales bacterium RIFCSPLOWO2_02_FULL_57_47]|nr:MAG: transcriptional regulator [Gallionellales bacterium RIFCSPLOWO2_02_FULL_57_47]OGT08880.1 MAG: transcriptional regulator [Gallionellales bacterium RIFCSPHIGHO2_02_FULL_57_16]